MAEDALAELAPRDSLLDLMKRLAGDAKTTTHQLIIASELGEEVIGSVEAIEDLASEYKTMFQNLHERNRFIRVTGLYLIYPRFCLHFMELPTEIIALACKKVSKHEAQGRLRKSTILCSSDVQVSLFSHYDFQILNLKGAVSADFKTNDPVEVVVADCLKNLDGLGGYTRKASREQGGSLTDLQAAVPELIPPQGVLDYLTKHKQLESLKSYSNRMNQHLHVVLDGDLQWPIPERLYPYD